MGQWNITVRGVGAHHNKKYTTDANRMAAQFVKDLRAAGHTVVSASITYGGDDNLTDAEAYLDDKSKQDSES